jgi:hypothetical protein
MEIEIKQDFTMSQPVFYLITAVVLAFLLFAGVTGFFITHDWHPLALLVGVSIFSIWFVRFGLRTSLENAEASQKRWLLTDDGLVRTYGSGKRETIRWEQIQDMRWGRHLGLKIRWEESEHVHRVREFTNEFKKWQTGRYWCWILVREAGARDLFRHANKEWVDIKI